MNEINRRQGKYEQMPAKNDAEAQRDMEKLATEKPGAYKALGDLGLTDEIENSGGIRNFIEEQAIIQNRLVENSPILYQKFFKENLANGMSENYAQKNAKNRVIGLVIPSLKEQRWMV